MTMGAEMGSLGISLGFSSSQNASDPTCCLIAALYLVDIGLIITAE